MFDTYVSRNVSERVTENVHVTEKRAPTDESVRILREMEAAARAEVLKTIRVANTHIEAVIYHQADTLNALDQYAVIYKVHGLRQIVRYEHNSIRHDSRVDAMEALADGLVKALSEDIARHLLAGLGKQISESLR